MAILEFAAEVIFLSASGVLSPGPLFITNLIYGSKHGLRAGIKIALGHTIVEFPLIIFLALALFRFLPLNLDNESLRIIGLIGGVAIIFFSISQISDVIKKGRVVARDNKNKKHDNSNHFLSRINKKKKLTEGGPLILGIIFSALNPFFLVWWLTVGLKLISDSLYLFGIVAGLIFLFSFHIWMDYAWLGVTSYMIYKGRSILKEKFYQLFLVSISTILACYGFYVVIAKFY
jgi:threonine/homoserine/homoserine lactone efflux protein